MDPIALRWGYMEVAVNCMCVGAGSSEVGGGDS